MTRFILRTTFLASFVLSAPLAVVSAQDSPNTFTAGLGAIVLLTRSTVTPQGGPLTVGYLTQPLVSADWRKSWLHAAGRSEEHTSELQLPCNLVCRLLLEKKT